MSPEDADTHLAGEDNAQMRWLSGGVSTKESVLDWIARNAALWDAGGPVFNRGVVEKSTGELVGMVEANTDAEHIEGIGPGEANISYGLYAAARGKGYATRAVNLMTEFLSERGIGAAVIKVSRANTKSIRVPKRCGFEQSGSLIAKDGEELVVFRKRLSQA